jgi:hypothetical protein
VAVVPILLPDRRCRSVHAKHSIESLMMDDVVVPAPWAIGPPPPRKFTVLTRVLQAACFLLMLTWVTVHLGGLKFSPTALGDGANDTSQLFNWHPLLITLAFPLLMGEAILSYKSPILALQERYSVHVGHVQI